MEFFFSLSREQVLVEKINSSIVKLRCAFKFIAPVVTSRFNFIGVGCMKKARHLTISKLKFVQRSSRQFSARNWFYLSSVCFICLEIILGQKKTQVSAEPNYLSTEKNR